MSFSVSRLVVLAFALLTLAGCKENTKAHQAPQFSSLKLPVMMVQVEQIPRLYRVPGSVKSDERIEVSSRITGYIQKITVHEGDRIAKGDIVVEIDPTEVEGAINRAQAALESANTALIDAVQDVTRISRLQKKGIVSNENYRKAKVRRDVARSKLVDAKATLDTALAGRRYASVRSTINGVVVVRHKQTGDLATPGMSLLTIESRTRLLFKTSVAESRIGNVHAGEKVRVEIDALGRTGIDGVVLRVIPSGDPVTRRYDVEIALPPKLGAFPGMFGRVHFIIGSDKQPVVLRSALAERGGLRGVFVVDKEKRARFRWLRTGREWPDRVEIKAGLEGGETILARDDRRVRDGDLILVAGQTASNE